jgi:hypothetical protein
MDRRLRRSEGANAHRLFTGRWLTDKGLRAKRRAAALRFARNKGGVCARLGAEATDYGLRATRKPVPS